MATFEQILKKKSKEWNAPDMMNMANAPRGKKIPFSSPLMNWCTYGGIPRDKITEFHGAPGGGKSTSAIDICKNAYKVFEQEYEEEVADLREKAAKDRKTYQGLLEDLIERGPKQILYVDLENSFDGDWAKTLGINLDEINIMTTPDVSAEEILETCKELICTGQVGLLVLDSLPSLVTSQELDKKIGERTVASLAGPLSVWFRKIVPLLTRYKCTFLYINQIRDNMDNPYVVNTPGGQAPKFYSSLRILFQIGKPVDFLGNELPNNAESPAGYKINAKIIKQKSAPNNRRNGTYFLMADSGIREDFDFVQLAISPHGIFSKRSGWYTLRDPYTKESLLTDTGAEVKINGLPKVYAYLKEHTEYYNSIRKYILDDIDGRTAEETNYTDFYNDESED